MLGGVEQILISLKDQKHKYVLPRHPCWYFSQHLSSTYTSLFSLQKATPCSDTNPLHSFNMTTTALSSGWDSGFANIDLQSSPTTEAEVSTPSEISNAQLAQTPSDHEDDGDQGPDRRDVEANTDSNENREGSTGWVWARSRLRKLIKEAKGAASLTVVSFVGRQ